MKLWKISFLSLDWNLSTILAGEITSPVIYRRVGLILCAGEEPVMMRCRICVLGFCVYSFIGESVCIWCKNGWSTRFDRMMIGEVIVPRGIIRQRQAQGGSWRKHMDIDCFHRSGLEAPSEAKLYGSSMLVSRLFTKGISFRLRTVTLLFCNLGIWMTKSFTLIFGFWVVWRQDNGLGVVICNVRSIIHPRRAQEPKHEWVRGYLEELGRRHFGNIYGIRDVPPK